MDKNLDHCAPSMTGEHHWRPYLSGGYKCIYCGQQWVPVEPCVDPDEIGAHKEKDPESPWPGIIGAIVGIVLALIMLLMPMAR